MLRVGWPQVSRGNASYLHFFSEALLRNRCLLFKRCKKHTENDEHATKKTKGKAKLSDLVLFDKSEFWLCHSTHSYICWCLFEVLWSRFSMDLHLFACVIMQQQPWNNTCKRTEDVYIRLQRSIKYVCKCNRTLTSPPHPNPPTPKKGKSASPVFGL